VHGAKEKSKEAIDPDAKERGHLDATSLKGSVSPARSKFVDYFLSDPNGKGSLNSPSRFSQSSKPCIDKSMIALFHLGVGQSVVHRDYDHGKRAFQRRGTDDRAVAAASYDYRFAA